MPKYIEWDDVAQRYPVIAEGNASDVLSGTMVYAEAMIESLLSKGFTIPFSSNNITVKDLCIDMTYARYWMTKKPEDASRMMGHIYSYCAQLVNGELSMMTDSGDLVNTDGSGLGAVYNPTKDYHPVFGMGDAEGSHVDSGQLYDEYWDFH